MYSVSILTIGSEVLDGRVQDSNSNFICKRLSELGLEVSHILTCTDVISDIKALIKFAREKSNILIISGGLGPTSDDLTRESVAEFYSKKLLLNSGALDEMKSLYQKRGRVFNPINEKQAYLPEGSIIIPNPVGTAPGFMIEESAGDKIELLFSLPGVPIELKAMFTESVGHYLKKLKGISPLKVRGFKCFGLPEAAIGAKIEELKIPEEIFVSYRASFPEVHVALKTHSNELDAYYNKTLDAVGREFIFTEDLNLSYEELCHKLLSEKNYTLATAESCTAGMLSSHLTDVPGSSKTYIGSFIAYANSVKENVLGIDNALIKKFGAVSAETAEAMAVNCRDKIKSDIALSITGIAGPDGGTQEKPVGLFYVGIADGKESSAHKFFLPLKRKQIRLYASYAALDVLRRHLQGIAKLPDAKLPG